MNKTALRPSSKQDSRECGKLPMCEKCTALDKKIEQYRRLASAINDQLTIDRIKTSIAELELQKAALHPQQA
jgi:hypothetical protein